jgi:hypothetical protein
VLLSGLSRHVLEVCRIKLLKVFQKSKQFFIFIFILKKIGNKLRKLNCKENKVDSKASYGKARTPPHPQLNYRVNSPREAI